MFIESIWEVILQHLVRHSHVLATSYAWTCGHQLRIKFGAQKSEGHSGKEFGKRQACHASPAVKAPCRSTAAAGVNQTESGWAGRKH